MLGMNAGSATTRNHNQEPGLLVLCRCVLTPSLLDVMIERTVLSLSFAVNFLLLQRCNCQCVALDISRLQNFALTYNFGQVANTHVHHHQTVQVCTSKQK